MEFNIFFWIGISLTGIIITVILLMLRVSRIEKYLSEKYIDYQNQGK
ncbi:hypothetical protein [Actinobacillus porcinus]|nr:hypothetical protein [Actinobacillus porcinus]MDY6215127.1 hypothetical protein [Actinobacillus porcinus]